MVIGMTSGEEVGFAVQNFPIDIALEGLRLPNNNGAPDKLGLERKHKKEVPRTAGSKPPLGILRQRKELDNEGE